MAGTALQVVAADVHSVLFAVFAEHGVVGCEQVVNGEAVGALYLFELRKATGPPAGTPCTYTMRMKTLHCSARGVHVIGQQIRTRSVRTFWALGTNG